MRGINDSITHSLRALLTRHGRTTCRVSLHCRLNVFCLFCAAKVRNIPGRNKKIPEDFVGRKASGNKIKWIIKDYSGLLGVAGSSAPHSLTVGLMVTSVASDDSSKVYRKFLPISHSCPFKETSLVPLKVVVVPFTTE